MPPGPTARRRAFLDPVPQAGIPGSKRLQTEHYEGEAPNLFPGFQQKAMFLVLAIMVGAHDISAIVDPEGESRETAGQFNPREYAMAS